MSGTKWLGYVGYATQELVFEDNICSLVSSYYASYWDVSWLQGIRLHISNLRSIKMKEKDELEREMDRVRSEANLRVTILDVAHKSYMLSLDRRVSEAEIEYCKQIDLSHRQFRLDLLTLAKEHGVDLQGYLEEKVESGT